MPNEIISYQDMCSREALSLQQGMNYRPHQPYSIILMSMRRNAPYRDQFLTDGRSLVYEGHDVPRSESAHDPKSVDQVARMPSGTLTQNGQFLLAVDDFKSRRATPRPVRVYEKIHVGIWSFNGLFDLVDAWQENDGRRMVYRFKLQLSETEQALEQGTEAQPAEERRRLIPTGVKIEVWRRDKGKCVVCGSSDELHFDHDLPFSMGGTSLSAKNVQLLCARHNLSKGAKIR